METTKQPLITVVMPNYNGRRFVEQAIDSVLNQTYSNFELLVVDDCSKDDSLQLIQQKAQSDDRIRIIALEHNAGVANARNVGIKEAKGEFIALLDNDDLWTEDKLERQLALAQKGADIVYCSYDFIDEQNNSIKKPFVDGVASGLLDCIWRPESADALPPGQWIKIEQKGQCGQRAVEYIS